MGRFRLPTVAVYSDCVSVALFIQRAKRMRHIVVSSVFCLVVPYFSTSHKRHGFGGENIEKNVFFFFSFSLQRLSETFLVLRRFHLDTTINVHGFLYKVSVILVGSQ